MTPVKFSAIADRFDKRYDQRQKHLDLLCGIISSTMANCHRKTGTAEFKPETFMPKYQDTPEETQGPSAEQLHTFFKAIVVPAFAGVSDAK